MSRAFAGHALGCRCLYCARLRFGGTGWKFQIPPDDSLPSLRYGSESSPPWTSPAYDLPWSAYWTAYHSDSYYAGSNEDRLASIFRGRVGGGALFEPELWRPPEDELREQKLERRYDRVLKRERERERIRELRREEQRRKDELTRERLREERYLEKLRIREKLRQQALGRERRAERRRQQAILGLAVPSARSSHIRALDGTHAWRPGGGSLCGRMPKDMDDWPVGQAAR